MRDGLKLLMNLEEIDVLWLLEHGRESQVIANTVILQEGRKPDALSFVLEGLVEVRVASLPRQAIVTLGPGELLGEMSFLEGCAASATVCACENSLLLHVAYDDLKREFDARPDFAARLYRAFALTASQRLRDRERRMGISLAGWKEQKTAKDEVGPQLNALLADFKGTLQDVDRAAIKNEGEVTTEDRELIHAAFHPFVIRLNEIIGDGCGHDESLREELGAVAQRELLPYLLMARNAERLYSKPRGYAGDFLSIDWMYRNEAGGSGRLGPILDRCFLDEPAARAVRNRRGLLYRRIHEHATSHPDRPVRVTTMACGPAREIFDAIEQLPDPEQLEATLIDIDQEALEFVRREVDRRGLEKQVRLHHANLAYLAIGRQKIDIEPQDLIYSIGLIDYFNDKFVVKLMNYGERCLRPGGEMILGNFHPRNEDKALMDYVIDWRLIHRSEEDMDRLYSTSRFDGPCTSIETEEAGVNIFAACCREA